MWPGPLVRPPCRRDALAEVDEILFRNVDAEGAHLGTGHGGLGSCHGGLRSVDSPGAHSTSTMSGFPFSTTYVASSAPLAVPTFFTAWIVSAGTKKTSPALSVVGGSPSTWYSSDPSRT